MTNIIVYADGACSKNPGEGGWASILITDYKGGKAIKRMSGYYPFVTEVTPEAMPHLKKGKTKKPYQQDGRWVIETTNNRMELSAVIHAVEVIKKPEEVDLIIRTDSQLAVNQFPGKWKVNDNIDLVLRGRELLNRFKSYRFEWVKGHASNPFNNECDQMAVAAIKKKKGDITVEVLNE
jgi:ribonuclease HI